MRYIFVKVSHLGLFLQSKDSTLEILSDMKDNLIIMNC